MKRKIGFIALTVAALTFMLCVITMQRFDFSSFVFLGLVYGAALITAIVCLAGDVIRFIGKCFSQGANEGRGQECSRVCPLCGKPLSSNARFCSDCGCELTKNS